MTNRQPRLPSSLKLGGLMVRCVVAVALVYGAVKGCGAWWYRAELTRAERELASRDPAGANRRLQRLSARWPGLAEVEYLLGASEAALGHVDLALAAWSRVPRGSPIADQAALEQGRLALEHGRLAIAEECVAPYASDTGERGQLAARLVDQLDLLSGRPHTILRRLERRWKLALDRAGLLCQYWELTGPFPLRQVREALDRMAQEAPDDDRVWLGQAHVAIAMGRYDQADLMLQRCDSRRLNDKDVLRCRLNWALAAGRLDRAMSAASRLSASSFTPAEIALVMARLAALRGDVAAERTALLRRVELAPGDPAAWERLAELAARAGLLERVTWFRNRKSEVNRTREEFRRLMGAAKAGDLSKAAEIARTAELLGRHFEARGWWTISVVQNPEDQQARAALDRLSRPDAVSPPANEMLVDIIGGGNERPTPTAVSNTQALIIPTFRDVTKSAGLRFVYDNDPTPLRRLPETMAGGVGLIDYDGDGWLDVYAVQGGKLLAGDPVLSEQKQGDRLFRNNSDGSFEDVTAAAGLMALRGGYGHGVAVGDYDNDGHPDLFITRWRSYALYRNKGDGTFEDATVRAGLDGPHDWPTSAAFSDLDGDGDLDLFVCHYLEWDPQSSRPCPNPDRPKSYLYCVPRGFRAEADHAFRNDGGRFVDVTQEAGIVDRDGRGLGVIIADLDDDGRPDIFVANDMTANYLFRNRGGCRFEEVGESAGVASSGEGGYQAGMGIACGDLDGDGRPDLAVTNFYGESTSLFINLGRGLFADRTSAAGLRAPSRSVLGFGASFLDANNDGRLDLATANGHVNDYRPAVPYAMPAQLFLGDGAGRLADVSNSAGPCWQVPRVARGMAAGDLDNDGRLDLVIVAEQEPLVYFRNQGPAGHFITFKLEGTAPGSNRDAVGARVTLTAGGRRQVVSRIGGGSFLSASDDRLHFGLGEMTSFEEVEVRWPSGAVDRHTGLAVDTAHRLKEGQTRASALPGWRPQPTAP
jgi:enediyne biosynthesis protein E4